jgi:hypothetical protein
MTARSVEPAHVGNEAESLRAIASEKASEELLRAASLLLAGDGSLRAVQALHGAVAGTSPAQTQGAGYASRAHAEREHRRIIDALRTARTPKARITTLPELIRRGSVWIAWCIVGGIVVALLGRHGLAWTRRWRWQGEHPDGAWISRYYSNVRFEGLPVTRYDDNLNYNFHSGAPAEGMLRDLWSARWDTCVDVKRDIELDLTLLADDRGRLFVDGVQRLDVPRAGKTTGIVPLSVGIHRLRVDFVERWGSARVRLGGIEFSGTEDYSFRRPTLRGDTASCD